MSDAPPAATDVSAREQAKWDAFYAEQGEAEETPAIRAFGTEFAGVLRELLPAGGAVLEAGSGAGFQSLALAREGRLAVSLLDISPQALEAARRLFARNGLTADARPGDAFATGRPEFDLVFNAGVLEHYTHDQQVAFLKGMASRSTGYVLVLVPNRLCYWYWVWRVQEAARRSWPYGKECPQADLSAAFRDAGLTYLGQTYLGAEWTEDLIGYVRGLPDEVRDEILAVHRAGLVDASHRCYLTAALGRIGPAAAPPPARWQAGGRADEMRLAELTAVLADSLAHQLAREAEWRKARQAEAAAFESQAAKLAEVRTQLTHTEQTLGVAEAKATELQQVRASRGYRLAQKLAAVRRVVAPSGSWRAATARALVRTARAAVRPVKWLLSPLARRLTPPPPGFAILRRAIARSGRRPFVFLPSIPWDTFLFQRPQHLAREIAKLGHVVVYTDYMGIRDVNAQGVREVEQNVYVYDGPDYHLATLPSPILWAFSYNFHLGNQYPPTTTKLYDWIDDLAVFPHDQEMLRRNHAQALQEAAVVTATARQLHSEILHPRPDAIYLPNAVEVDRFADPSVRPPVDPALQSLLARSKGVVGYWGALARWFDYGLVKEVARRLPDWAFVLIGPDYDGSLATSGLHACPNVALLGPRNYTALPGYARLFDVATVPFQINEITLATSPLKLFEYFACGLPVVTTPMPECAAFPEVRVATTAAEFAAAVVDARESGRAPAVRERLLELARENTWAARAKTAVEALTGGGLVVAPRPATVRPPVAA
jgi:SAM-dependent methyltransferase/glycosyltransferase involved in cell wall biosynthesis